jgi:sarcosine oxidase subunit beta
MPSRRRRATSWRGGADRKRGGRRAVDPGAGLNGVDAEYLAALRDLIDRRFPGFDDVRVTGTWSGIVTVTPDWHQIVGVPKGYENFYNILGPSGHGFKEAPGFAESVAAEILGREPPNDLSPYRLERFDSGDTFKGRYGEESRA